MNDIINIILLSLLLKTTAPFKR